MFVQSAKRRQKPKEEYFNYHGINKTPNYELHHIVPFKRANNQTDANFIDDKRNLIYLSSSKHAEFTSSQNKNIRTSYSAPNLLFLHIDNADGFIVVDLTKQEALISENRIQEVVDYNKKLLSKFYNIP